MSQYPRTAIAALRTPVVITNANPSVSGKGIVLQLKDNGVGFNPKKLHPGYGIKGMIKRVQLLGGIEIQTATAQGTQIYIILPL